MSSASLGSSLGGSLKGSSRPRHAKSKSGVPVDEMPLIQGWIARWDAPCRLDPSLNCYREEQLCSTSLAIG